MIKRIRFVSSAPGVGREHFDRDWPSAVAEAADAPAGARPSRVAVCTTMLEFSDPDPRHDGLAFEWFTDDDHLARFESWLGTAEGESAQRGVDELVDGSASPLVVAEECVLRGAEWLEQRWRNGGQRFKHLAIALRAADLSPAEFSERWRNHAGRVGATTIPDAARGRAYVQDHPRPRSTGAWAYDALNEVWFDDLDGLATRVEWFRENWRAGGDELFGRSWFLAAREQVLDP